MAPSPENDNTPKAPDKSDKTKNDKTSESRQQGSASGIAETDTREASVSGLDDGELKALLDEAIAYKSPKDRQGKSELFNNLLTKAEDYLRNARATSASGSEQVRYYNTTATRRNRHRRQPSSISENLSHGGSLNNLAKEELYEAANQLQRPKKTVSARQREGGSLPCNVNVPGSYDKQFFEEARRKKEHQRVEYTAIDMESESLLEHDALNQSYSEQTELEVVQTRVSKVPVKYTSRATLEIGNVDDGVSLPALERTDKSANDHETFKELRDYKTRYSLLAALPGQPWFGFDSKTIEEKKVDENGNALGQNNSETKKNKKEKRDKNVVLINSQDVVGHRSDIINDVDKLIQYIDGNEEGGGKPKTNVHKSKLHKHVSTEEKPATKKQRTRSKAKNGSLQKSTSMEEISTTKLEDFNFSQDKEIKVPLRSTKSNADRPKERRSWGNSEQLQFQNLQLYANASAENLESADFRVVTKKKKSKKRRNSISGRRQQYSNDPHNFEFNRTQSPELRRKSACSVPHSEKSNDSSDADSVHSLPIDANCGGLSSDINAPISYADIAKNSNSLERPKWNRPPSERKSGEKSPEKSSALKEKLERTPPPTQPQPQPPVEVSVVESPEKEFKPSPSPPPPATSPSPKTADLPENPPPVHVEEKQCTVAVKTASPPDVSYMQNWPCIQNNKLPETKAKTPANHSNKSVKNSNNNIKNMKNAQMSVAKPHHPKTSPVQNSVAIINSNINNNNIQIIQNDEPILLQASPVYLYPQHMPANIPDVSTIEKMHFQQLQNSLQQAPLNHIEYRGNHLLPFKIPTIPPFLEENMVNSFIVSNNAINENRAVIDHVMCEPLPIFEKQCVLETPAPPAGPVSVLANNQGSSNDDASEKSAGIACDSERTRPAVVILSGDTSKEISGITFGFGINEQLLCGDVCSDFIARYITPETINAKSYNHEKIVNFVGIAWEDIINESNGKVQYYEEL